MKDLFTKLFSNHNNDGEFVHLRSLRPTVKLLDKMQNDISTLFGMSKVKDFTINEYDFLKGRLSQSDKLVHIDIFGYNTDATDITIDLSTVFAVNLPAYLSTVEINGFTGNSMIPVQVVFNPDDGTITNAIALVKANGNNLYIKNVPASSVVNISLDYQTV